MPPARSYVRDIDYFTLTFDHSFSSPVGISRSASEMAGYLIDPDGNVLDACTSYTRRGIPCNPAVSVGVDGKTDVFTLSTLLESAGVSSLDHAGGGKLGGISGSNLRLSGLVLFLEIRYSNYRLDLTHAKGTGTVDERKVVYTYHATVAEVGGNLIFSMLN